MVIFREEKMLDEAGIPCSVRKCRLFFVILKMEYYQLNIRSNKDVQSWEKNEHRINDIIEL